MRIFGPNLCLVVVLCSSVWAQNFRMLYQFRGSTDGQSPRGDVLLVSPGYLYGTTYDGGTGKHGTIFKLGKNGETVLHSFVGNDGSAPEWLLRDSTGNFYGTTGGGGPNQGGTIFELDPSGNETVLYSFPVDESHGWQPNKGLIRDNAGNFYGTTSFGGGSQSGSGVVFKVDANGNETVLHSFTGAPDGTYPDAGVLLVGTDLYGVTPWGGTSGFGILFRLDANGNETVLHTFSGFPSDGGVPYAGLVRDALGNLYGTTMIGGLGDDGTVFKLDRAGNMTILYSFQGIDGSAPTSELVLDKAGNIYGTTSRGGAKDIGTVFKLDTSGNETVLHSFSGRSDGAYPQGPVTLDPFDNLYGTTSLGACCKSGDVFTIRLSSSQ